MRVKTKTDRQVDEYKTHQRQLSLYEMEHKPLVKINKDKMSSAEHQRSRFLVRKIRALRQQLRID
jgi:hypothetical protein